MLRFITIICVFVLLLPAARGQDGLAWMKGWWERARNFELPDNVRVRLVVKEDFPSLSESDLAAWQERLADFPEHPERNALRNAQRQAKHGPDVSEVDFARGTRDRWRITETRDFGDSLVIMDRAAAGDTSWKLGGEDGSINLVVGVLDGPAAAGQDVRASEGGFLRRLEKLIFGPIGLGTAEYVEVRTCVRKGATFRAEAGRVGEDLIIAELSGGISADGQPLVLRATEFEPDGKGVKRTLAASGHLFDERLGVWVASEVEEIERASGVRRVYQLRGTEEVSDSEVNRLITMPTVEQGDPVRGDIAMLTVYDTRPGVSEKVSYDGVRVVRDELPEALRVGAGREWRWVGWSLLGLGVGVIVVVRIRHK